MIYIPVPISERQQVRTAIEWIIDAADKRPYRSVDRRLAGEILAILAGDSPVLRKLDDRHKQAMINRCVGARPVEVFGEGRERDGGEGRGPSC